MARCSEQMWPSLIQARPASGGTGRPAAAGVPAAAPSTQFGVIEFDHYAGGDIFDGIQASVEYFNANGLR